MAEVLSGIPQGSVLGPLLFILFVNDMPDVVHSYIQMFADDTKVFKEIASPQDSHDLQSDLDALQKWSADWLLSFNAEKCKVLHVGNKGDDDVSKYSMIKDASNIELETTNLEKDLGAYIDPTLNFSTHCEKQVNKANRILGLIRRSYSYLDEKSLVKLFTSLVRPHLEYCNSACSPVFKKDCQLLENVQRRATKLVSKLRDLTYEERLKRLDLPSLYFRRARGDMIETYKHLHDIYTNQASYIKKDTTQARGHSRKLKKERASKVIRQNFFSLRVTNAWNRLPVAVVEAPSLNCFKNRLDGYWRQYQFDQCSVLNYYNYDSSQQDRPKLPTGY